MARLKIAFALYKGGVGKTTVMINTAVALAALLRSRQPEARVLVIDADTQAGATMLLLGRKLDDKDPTISTLLAGQHQIGEVIIRLDEDSSGLDEEAQSALAGIDLIPASPDGKLRVGAPEEFWALRDLLDDETLAYDYILMDSGYGDTDLTTLALVASDAIIGVSNVTALGLNGLSQLIDKVKRMRRSFSHVHIAGVITNDFSVREISDQAIFADMESQLGPLLWSPPIPHRAIVKRSQDARLPLSVFKVPAARALVDIFDIFADRLTHLEVKS